MNPLISNWLIIFASGVVTISGIAILLRRLVSFIRNSFQAPTTSKNELPKSALLTGFGAFLFSIGVLPFVVSLLSTGMSGNFSSQTAVSYFVCFGPLALLFGIAAAIGEYARFGSLNWFDNRLSNIVRKQKQNKKDN
jgi:hypothetical protein